MSSFITLPVHSADSVVRVPTTTELPIFAQEGDIVYVEDVGVVYLYTGFTWGALESGVSPKQSIINAVAGITSKLDLDSGAVDTDYFSLYGSPTFSQLAVALQSIGAKLDLDLGVTDTNYAPLLSILNSNSTVGDFMSVLRALTFKLDLDSGITDTNYHLLTDDFAVSLVTTVVIPATSVRTSASIPYQLLPAPGAGKYHQIERIEAYLDFNTVAFDPNFNIIIRYAGSEKTVSNNPIQLEGSLPSWTILVPSDLTDITTLNESLIARGAPVDSTFGDSNLKLKITHRVILAIT